MSPGRSSTTIRWRGSKRLHASPSVRHQRPDHSALRPSVGLRQLCRIPECVAQRGAKSASESAGALCRTAELGRWQRYPRAGRTGHLQQYRAALRGLPSKDYAEITRLICDPDRAVFCLGGRFTQMLATYFHHCLREPGPARLVGEGSASWADYLLDVRRGDVLVVLDFRRYQRDVLEFASGAAAQGAAIILRHRYLELADRGAGRA